MRLTYLVAIIVVATLHAGDTALAAAKAPNHAAIANVASADNVHSLDTTAVIGGRMLRKVKEDTASKKDDEERGTEALLNLVKRPLSREAKTLKRKNAFVHRFFQRQKAFVKRLYKRQNAFKRPVDE